MDVCYILIFHAVQIVVDFAEAAGCDLVQQSGELVLPFLAMCQYCKLQWRRIQQNELNRQYRLLHLHVVCYFCVPAQTRTNII